MSSRINGTGFMYARSSVRALIDGASGQRCWLIRKGAACGEYLRADDMSGYFKRHLHDYWSEAAGLAFFFTWVFCTLFGCGLVTTPFIHWGLEYIWEIAGLAEAVAALIRRAVASDVRAGPLERAKKNIERYGVGNLVAVRLSDGLDAVQPSEAEDIVVAGMGGLMIAEIISRAPWLKEGGRHLILQPMTRAEDLRRSLSDQGFAILRERAVREEHHLYTAMLCAYSPGRRGKGTRGSVPPRLPRRGARQRRPRRRHDRDLYVRRT